MQSRPGSPRVTALRMAALTVGGGVLLGACGGEEATQRSGGAGTGAPGDPTGTFVAVEITEGGKPRAAVEGTRIALTFEGDMVRATAGCNQMSGSASFAQDRLRVADMAMTEMGCPGDGRHEQDQFVADFLGAGPTYAWQGDHLALSTARVRMLLGPEHVVEPRVDPREIRWEITHLTKGPPADGAGGLEVAASATQAPPGAFLIFAEDRVTGNDGCNALSGDAELADGTVRFGPIASTKRACPGVRGSGHILKVLDGVVGYSVKHGVGMVLEHPSGAGLQLRRPAR